MASTFRSRLLAQQALMQRLKQQQRRNPLQAGFTLIELLIVVIIIGILSSIAIPAFLSQRDRAEVEGVKAEARSFVNGCFAADITGDADPSNPYSWSCPDDTAAARTFDNGKATATVNIGSGGSIESVTAVIN